MIMQNVKKVAVPILVTLLLGVSIYSIFLYSRRDINIENSAKTAPDIIDSNSDLLSKISLLIELPDEKPTIATVSDPERLKEQVFFARAKKGDVVLIYTQARKAILYDPIANKIIDVAPIALSPLNNP
jgi:hypothetical protein